MRRYYDYLYLDTGKVGFSLPGFTAADDGVTAYAQDDPVVRVGIDTAGAAWLDVNIGTQTGDWAGSDPLQVSQHIAVAQGQTAYIPIAEIIKTAIVRTFSGISATPDKPCVEMTLRFELSDASLTLIDTNDVPVYAFDAHCNHSQPSQDWRNPGIPDKVRLVQNRKNYFTFPTPQLAPVGFGFSFVQYLSDNSNTDYPIDVTTGSRLFKVPSTNALHVTSLAFRHDSGNMNIIAFTKVEWVDCGSDNITLLWWSPELGGWKTMVADVTGTADSVTERSEQEMALCRVDGVTGLLGFSVRFPLLTQRDYMYYRDILLSDEVYVVEDDTDSFDGVVSEIRRAVRVSGSLPAWKTGDVKDFEFNVIYNYTDEL